MADVDFAGSVFGGVIAFARGDGDRVAVDVHGELEVGIDEVDGP